MPWSFFFILMRIRILDPFCKNIDPKFLNFLRVILLLDLLFNDWEGFNDPWIRGSANAEFEIKYFWLIQDEEDIPVIEALFQDDDEVIRWEI